MALGTYGSLSWSPSINSAIKETYYILGLHSDLKRSCNIIANYFNITNNKLDIFINKTTSVNTAERHVLPVTIINSFVLRFHNDIETTTTLVEKIKEKFKEENLACRIKKSDNSRNLIDFHYLIVEDDNVDSQYDFQMEFEKQQLSINDINMLPQLEECQ